MNYWTKKPFDPLELIFKVIELSITVIKKERKNDGEQSGDVIESYGGSTE